MNAFIENSWPSLEIRKSLALIIGVKLKGVDAWFQRTRSKSQKEAETETIFPEYPEIIQDMNKEFQGLDLRLLESVFKQERFPDKKWLRDISEFTKSNVDDVAKWFANKNRSFEKEFDVNSNFLII